MIDTRPRVTSPAPRREWVRASSAAEAIGMSAAATAAVAASALTGSAGLVGTAAFGLLLVVAGGLVEGYALGRLQSRVLGSWLPYLRERRYLVATVLVAGVGWAAASAPAVLAGSDAGTAEPPLALVLLGAAGLGLLMGAALGTAQAVTLRGAVRHPWRWVGASAAAWPLPMAVIFLGATTPDADWPRWTVLALAPVTGAVAGALLGLVSGWFLPSLDGPPVANRVVLAALASPLHAAPGRSLLGLAITGRRSGRVLRFPVQYALGPDGFVVVPARHRRKSWWRNLGCGPVPAEVLVDGAWSPAWAVLLAQPDTAYGRARATYLRRFPQVRLPDLQPLVLVTLDSP